MIQDTSAFHKFKKCSYIRMGQVSQSKLLQEAQEQPSALIIVNSKKMAKELYKLCAGETYHLSTYMAACDRQRVIGEIRKMHCIFWNRIFPGAARKCPRRVDAL